MLNGIARLESVYWCMIVKEIVVDEGLWHEEVKLAWRSYTRGVN